MYCIREEQEILAVSNSIIDNIDNQKPEKSGFFLCKNSVFIVIYFKITRMAGDFYLVIKMQTSLNKFCILKRVLTQLLKYFLIF